MCRRKALLILVALTATATPGLPQHPGEPRSVVVTAAASDAVTLRATRETLNRMEAAGELRLMSRFGDRRLRGRVHESFRQFHRGVPVHGGGLTLQRSGDATVSILGTLHRDIDVETVPRLSAADAAARVAAMAGVGPATAEPPTLTVLPTIPNGYALTWRVTMKDMHAWFIDAITGEPAKRESLLHEQEEVAVGVGLGWHDQRLKLSVSVVPGGLRGESYLAHDRLRGAEIVTLDPKLNPQRGLDVMESEVSWTPSDVASDSDNEWEYPLQSNVAEAHTNLGFVYDYLRQRQQWRGMDGDDGRIVAVANVLGYGNAFFVPPPFGPEGTGGLLFGVVDTPEGGRGLGALDIVGHELMHGVTHFSVQGRTGESFGEANTYVPGPRSISLDGQELTCGDSWEFNEGPSGPVLCSEDGRILLFWDEAGAINEAMSDIVGTAVEFAFHPPGEGSLRADYLIGEDTSPIRLIDDPGRVNLSDDGTLVYPDAMERGFRVAIAKVGEQLYRYTPLLFVKGEFVGVGGSGDYGFIHVNSTILSYSFVLAVEGGRHRSSGRAVTGVGGENREQVAQAYFRAMTELIPARGTFEMMAAAVRQSAVDLEGAASPVYAAVDQALAAVGLPAR